LLAGVFATAAAGALLLPALIQLVLVGGGLWLGASVAQRLFYRGGAGAGSSISPDGTIDVEARTVDDDWREEMFRWARPCLLGAGCQAALTWTAVSAGAAWRHCLKPLPPGLLQGAAAAGGRAARV
jgi:hypothetical protein